MFVMATIHSPSGSAPVKIRDLSSSGALVEGGVLPHRGSKIELVRGSLKIGGTVAWSRGKKAGLAFDACVFVGDWLPAGLQKESHARVDAIVQDFKAAAAPTLVVFPEPNPGHVSAGELVRLKAWLENLSEALAEDLDIVSRHGSKLQVIDLAAQLIGKLAVQAIGNDTPLPLDNSIRDVSGF